MQRGPACAIGAQARQYNYALQWIASPGAQKENATTKKMYGRNTPSSPVLPATTRSFPRKTAGAKNTDTQGADRAIRLGTNHASSCFVCWPSKWIRQPRRNWKKAWAQSRQK